MCVILWLSFWGHICATYSDRNAEGKAEAGGGVGRREKIISFDKYVRISYMARGGLTFES